MQLSEKDLTIEQTRKREERGGFLNGIVLVDTENLPPTSKKIESLELPLMGLQPDFSDAKVMTEAEVRAKSEVLERRTDRRVAPGQIEIKANVSIPVTRSSQWSAETVEERVEGVNGKMISGHIKGQRMGNQWNYEVSVWIDDAQLELAFELQKKNKASRKASRKR